MRIKQLEFIECSDDYYKSELMMNHIYYIERMKNNWRWGCWDRSKTCHAWINAETREAAEKACNSDWQERLAPYLSDS